MADYMMPAKSFVIACLVFPFGLPSTALAQANFGRPGQLNSDSKPDLQWHLGEQHALLAGATMLLLMHYDPVVDDEIGFEPDEEPAMLRDSLIRIGELYDRIGPGKVFAATYLLTWYHQRRKPELERSNFLRVLGESALYTAVTTYLAKTIIGRQRPYRDKGSKEYAFGRRIALNSAGQSMPSGHTSHIFALIQVLTRQTDKAWLKAAGWTLAAGVAMQRMNHRKHWGSDVLAGALVGMHFGRATLAKYPHYAPALKTEQL